MLLRARAQSAQPAGQATIEIRKSSPKSRFREALLRTAEMWAARSDTIYVPHTGVAALFAAAGEHDRALDWLELGMQIRHPNLPSALSSGPIFDSLHDNPRFQDLRRSMNLSR